MSLANVEWSGRGAQANRFRLDLPALLTRVWGMLLDPRSIRKADAREVGHGLLMVRRHLDELRRADTVESLRDFADLYCLLGRDVRPEGAPDFAAIAAMPPSHRKADALMRALEHYGFRAGFYGLEVKVDTESMLPAGQS